MLQPLDSEDPRLLWEGLRACGFLLRWEGDAITAEGFRSRPGATIFMGNNGTGLRFLLAQLAATPGLWVVDGVARLRSRPLAPLVEALRQLRADIHLPSGGGCLPLVVRGRSLVAGTVRLDPTASSQFVSALLLLAARLPEGFTLRLTGTPPSRPYLGLTVEVLEAFGVRVEGDAAGAEWRVQGGVGPATYAVEGDWSAAAFPLCAAALAGGWVEVLGVRRGSRQGDAAVLEILSAAGCEVTETEGGVALAGPARRPLVADLRDTPDLFPALAVVAARVGGELHGLEGLAAKESPRLEVMGGHLRRLGFAVEWDQSRLVAPPGSGGRAPGEALDPHGDHRIAMALAVAGCVVTGVRIANPACVVKSWPEFWSHWQALLEGK